MLQGVISYANAEASDRRLTALFAEGPSDQLKALEHLYGSFGKALLTLFRAISGGDDWSTLAAPIAKVGPLYEAAWVVYISFMVFGMLNILTGIFVDSAMKAADNDCA